MTTRLAGNVAWMVAMRWSMKLIGLVNTAILARFLSPEDFGVMALAMVAIELAIVLADGDVELAVIRQPAVQRSLLDSAWTLKIIAGTLVFVALAGISPMAGTAMADERIGQVVLVGGLRALILGFENIGTVEFRRKLDFAREFRYALYQRLASFVTGILLALWLRDWRALAWSGPAAAMVTLCLSFAMAPYRPRLSLEGWRTLWSFSRWQVLFNTARFSAERWDQFLVGKLAGAAAAGNYYVALDIALMPTREVMMPAGRALLPNYARLREPGEIAATFRAVLGFAATAALPMALGVSLVAEPLVALVLGPQWGEAIPYFRLFGIFAGLEGLWLMLDPLLVAVGRERGLALGNLAYAAVLLPIATGLAVLVGPWAIPLGRIAAMAVMLAVMMGCLMRWHLLEMSSLIGILWRPLGASAAMAAVVLALPSLSDLPLLALLQRVVVGAATYSVVLATLWLAAGRPQGPEKVLLDIALPRLNRMGLTFRCGRRS